MIDYFALLEQPRRPWLEAEALQAKFLAQSTLVHPDRVHEAAEAERQAATQRYTELNAAYTCLREPKDRLCHLLELERGARPSGLQRTPDGVMAFFLRVGELVRAVDAFLIEREQADSPMLKVRSFRQGLVWSEQVEQLQRALHVRREELLVELQTLDRAWDAAAARPGELPLDALEAVYRQTSYLARWTGQLQERYVRLAL